MPAKEITNALKVLIKETILSYILVTNPARAVLSPGKNHIRKEMLIVVIKRFMDDYYFGRMQEDFNFLPNVIKSFKGEVELFLRDNYFNLYYKGNSLARVDFKPDGKYEIKIHKEFVKGTSVEKDNRFLGKWKEKDDGYVYFIVEKDLLHPLLQKKYLDEFCSKVKKLNFKEELILEQMLITDNLMREDFLFIDRQVTDKEMNGKRMDLLALRQIECNKYSFIVIEVKLGNNSELSGNVADQLEYYIKHIEEYFDDYKKCYEENYKQKKAFGLIEKPSCKTIEIVEGVKGMVVICGYSVMAKEKIQNLLKNHSSLNVKQFYYELDL